MERIRKFFKDESGANLVEYALLVALVAVACIVTINALTGGIQTSFSSATTELNSAS
jgi:pilus assembly protein Flp/PilA